jgi:hypothetical protein
MRPGELVTALQATPMHDYDDLAARSVTQPPSAPGMYAWWQRPGALPGVPGVPHPSEPIELLYVGIAPNSASSSRNLRKRLSEHHHAAIGSSTFRRSLAAFLWEAEGWTPYFTDRPYLSPDDLAALASWQRANTFVQWVEVDQPWAHESDVILAMAPPLNQDHNHSHPFHGQVSAARGRLKAAGMARGRPT